MAHIQLVKQTSSGLLLPATPESCDFLHQIKIGEWIHADFKRVRNYAFHKRFFQTPATGIRLLDSERWGDHASRTKTGFRIR